MMLSAGRCHVEKKTHSGEVNGQGPLGIIIHEQFWAIMRGRLDDDGQVLALIARFQIIELTDARTFCLSYKYVQDINDSVFVD